MQKKIVYSLIFIFLCFFFSCDQTPQTPDLNKDWILKSDPQKQGEAEKWFAGDYSIQSDKKYAVSELMGPTLLENIWYFKDFDFSDKQNQQWMLRFSHAYDEAKIWLNGELLGIKHQFQTGANFDVSQKLKSGQNRLAIMMTNRDEIARSLDSIELIPILSEKELGWGKYFDRQAPLHPAELDSAVFARIQPSDFTSPENVDEIQTQIQLFMNQGVRAIILAEEDADALTVLSPFLQACHKSGLFLFCEIDVQKFLKQAKTTTTPVSEPQNWALLKTDFATHLNTFSNLLKMDGFYFLSADLLSPDIWQDIKSLSGVDSLLLMGDTENPALNANIFYAVRSAVRDDALSRIIFESGKFEQIGREMGLGLQNFPQSGLLLYKAPIECAAEGDAFKANLQKSILAYTLSANPLIDFQGNLTLSEQWQKYLEILGEFNQLFYPIIKLGDFNQLETANTSEVLAFTRQLDESSILVLINLSDREMNCQVNTTGLKGYMQEIFRKININLSGTKTSLKLAPYESRIYINATYIRRKSKSIYIPLGSGKRDDKDEN